MDGLLLVDKPAGLTSHDVVARIRRRLQGAKTGHFGTLDPLATGLLVVAAGKAVRFNVFYSAREKVYEGRIRLGLATDTYDAEGDPSGEALAVLPPAAELEAAALKLSGPLDQTPPPFSAKKLAGRPLYSYARKGQSVAAAPVRVVIHEFEVRPAEPPDIFFRIRCSSGTYIRSLAHDLGRLLGCGAHLAALRRTSVGEFYLEEARPLAEWEAALDAGQGLDRLIPLDRLVPELPEARVDAEGREFIRHGRLLPAERFTSRETESAAGGAAQTGIFRLVDPDGALIGLGKWDPMSGCLTPFVVLIPI